VGWKLGRVVLAVDRGMVSEENLTYLQRAGGHYIVGEKLRAAKAGAQEALARAGRYAKLRGNLMVKEVVVGEGEKRERYVVVKNPHQARLDAATRARTLERLEAELAGLKRKQKEGKAHAKAACRLVADRTLGRFVKQSPGGKLSVDRAKVRADEKLDGKYLLRCSDDTLTAEEIALGYKQLLEVERAWRDLKTTLEISPMYHRLADRIRAHVLLCMLALLVVRVAERRTGQTWNRIRSELDRLYEGRFRGKAGEVVRTSELTSSQLSLLNRLGIPKPPGNFSISPGIACNRLPGQAQRTCRKSRLRGRTQMAFLGRRAVL
jgi:transposase